MTNRMANIRVYLSGPMQYTKDWGTGWREEITAALITRGMHANNILDPVLDRTGKIPMEEERRRFALFKSTDNYRELKDLAKTIIRHDLRQVDISDCLILGIMAEDGKFPTTFGTTHEIITAVEQHKPIFVYSNLTWKQFPLWLIGLLPEPYYWANTSEGLADLIYSDLEENINKDTKWVLVEPIV